MIDFFNLKGTYIQGMTDEEFSDFCEDNPSFRIERLPDHQIVVARPLPVFDDQLIQSAMAQLSKWSKEKQLGTCINGKGFLLNNEAVRIATIAWVSTQQLVSAVINDRGLNKLCPDFVLEFRRSDDDLKTSKAKMKEWITNGCKLAWLIDEKREITYVFEKSKVRMKVGFDKKISGEPVLPGFELDLASASSRKVQNS